MSQNSVTPVAMPQEMPAMPKKLQKEIKEVLIFKKIYSNFLPSMT